MFSVKDYPMEVLTARALIPVALEGKNMTVECHGFIGDPHKAFKVRLVDGRCVARCPTCGAKATQKALEKTWKHHQESLEQGRVMAKALARSFAEELGLIEKLSSAVTTIKLQQPCLCGRTAAFETTITGDSSTEGFFTCKCGREFRIVLRPARAELTGGGPLVDWGPIQNTHKDGPDFNKIIYGNVKGVRTYIINFIEGKGEFHLSIDNKWTVHKSIDDAKQAAEKHAARRKKP